MCLSSVERESESTDVVVVIIAADGLAYLATTAQHPEDACEFSVDV